MHLENIQIWMLSIFLTPNSEINYLFRLLKIKKKNYNIFYNDNSLFVICQVLIECEDFVGLQPNSKNSVKGINNYNGKDKWTAKVNKASGCVIIK